VTVALLIASKPLRHDCGHQEQGKSPSNPEQGDRTDATICPAWVLMLIITFGAVCLKSMG